MAEDDARKAAVHVLISEDFFLQRVRLALEALKFQPTEPDWGGDLLEQVLGAPSAGVVVDLEAEEADMVELMSRLRADPRAEGLPMLGYCAQDDETVLRRAQEAGLPLVMRSSFAGNLVRILKGLLDPSEDSP